jgi:cell division protein FtsZ
VESAAEIAAALVGADMVFLTAGMGGGTGTGSIPVAAEIARRQGAVTISIVTTPFSFEMGRRQRNASQGLARLNRHSDTLIAISNDRLLQMKGGNLTIDVAFRVADDVLRQAVQGVTELITETGFINVDFAHIRRLMKLGGGALMSIGQGQGEAKTSQAIQRALNHPLLESISLVDAAAILVNFTGGADMTLYEVNEALTALHTQASPDVEIVMGVHHDPAMEGRVEAIMIVTGLGGRPLEEVLPGAERLQQAEAHSQAPAASRPVAQAAAAASPTPTQAAAQAIAQARAAQPPASAPAAWSQAGLRTHSLSAPAAPAIAVAQARPADPPKPDLFPAYAQQTEAPAPALPARGARELDLPAFLRRGRYLDRFAASTGQP